MTIKSDIWIRRKAKFGMIQPFVDRKTATDGAISYGCGSYGYDMRVADEWKIFTNVHSSIIDPKNFDPNICVDVKAPFVIIPANSFVLARSVERFAIPHNVLCVVLGKSTYARCGLILNVTPLEPNWYGHVTIEISNSTPLPAKVYANEGVAQVLFFESDEPCEEDYGFGGTYQDQPAEIVLPRIA